MVYSETLHLHIENNAYQNGSQFQLRYTKFKLSVEATRTIPSGFLLGGDEWLLIYPIGSNHKRIDVILPNETSKAICVNTIGLYTQFLF